jgi:ribosome recycling factor
MHMQPIIFSEGDTKSFESILRESMQAPIKHFEIELATIRTGRATVSLIENIKAECYGQLMSLKELATLSAPDARLLTIQPWDKSIIQNIEKAIQASDLGVNPLNDGELIRLQFPMISSERREELIKTLGKKTEECRISIRNVRKNAHNQLRDAEKNKLISEDFAMKLNQSLQKVTDEFIKQADDIHKRKEAELIKV